MEKLLLTVKEAAELVGVSQRAQVAADLDPAPLEHTCGRHGAERLYPEGISPQRLVAHWRLEHHLQPLPHAHHARNEEAA